MRHAIILSTAIILAVFAVALTAQPARADSGIQAPTFQISGTITSTIWIGTCSPYYTGVSEWPFGDWGLDNWHTFSTPLSNTLVGYIEQITNTSGYVEGARADMAWGPINGIENYAWWEPGGVSRYDVCQTCANTQAISDTCTTLGYSNTYYPNPFTQTVRISGWQQWWSSPASWDGRICPVWIGEPPEACANEYLTNTHLYRDTWTPSGSVSWTSSEYHLGGGGSVSNSPAFSETNYYSVTVYAKAGAGGYLSLGIDATFEVLTMSASANWAAYSATFSATTGSTVYIGAGAGTTSTIDVDAVCISVAPFDDERCLVDDYHLRQSESWEPLYWGGNASTAVWSMSDPGGGGPGVWRLTGNAGIQQELQLRQGNYDVFVVARATADNSKLALDLNGSQSLVYLLASGYTTYRINALVTQDGTVTAKLNAEEVTGGNYLYIDSVCFSEASAGDGTPPCGLDAETAAQSSSYISNGTFDSASNFLMPWITCDSYSFGFPLNIGMNCSSAPPKIRPYGWNGNNVGIGRTGHNGTGYSVGLYPTQLSNPFSPDPLYQPLSNASFPMGYNVVFRARRMFANGYLSVNDQRNVTGSDAMRGNWTDTAFWFQGGSSVSFRAGCQGSVCIDQVESNMPDAVQLDSVYIVPGPELTCGSVITTPYTPIGSCINPHSTFDAGETGWNLSDGATMGDKFVIMPQGSTISQYVKSSEVSGSYGDKSDSIVIGVEHKISIAARVQNADVPNSATVKVGAFQPGSQDVGVVNPTSSSAIQQFTFTFIPTAENVSNGAVNIALVADEGTGKGDLIIYQVCIRRDTSEIPPAGSCIGNWHINTGGDPLSTTVSYPDFVYNATSLISMKTYNVHAVGECVSNCAGILKLQTLDNDGNVVSEIPWQIGEAFDVNIMFSALPPNNPSDQLAEVKLVAYGDVDYSVLCLTDATTGAPPILPPGPMPYPECVYTVSGQLLQGVFYGLPPYSVPNNYSGTLESDSYAAELIYNYAIFPLVCTTLSIADWQYKTWAAWKATFNSYVLMMQEKLDTIIDLLRAILAKIGTATSTTPWWLEALWALVELFLRILVMLLELLFRFMFLIIDLLRSIVVEFRADDAVSFPITCTGDGEYICIALAGLLSLEDMGIGQYLNIGVDMAIAMLTIALAWWSIQQVRAMMQPGSSAKDE